MSEADRLYGLPIDEFVGERNALARQLRADGRREDAEAVAQLRKPSVAAWAANQALRSQPKAKRELFAAADALTKAQTSLLSRSGKPAALRDASERHRASVGALVDAARGLLDSNGRGLSDQMLERVRDTLTAASLDPQLREEAAAGRLAQEHAYAGFGAFGAAPAEEPAPKRDVEEERRRASAVRAAERKLAAASRALAAAERRLDGARRTVEEAAAKLADAERAVTAAQADRADAERDVNRAREA